MTTREYAAKLPYYEWSGSQLFINNSRWKCVMYHANSADPVQDLLIWSSMWGYVGNVQKLQSPSTAHEHPASKYTIISLDKVFYLFVVVLCVCVFFGVFFVLFCFVFLIPTKKYWHFLITPWKHMLCSHQKQFTQWLLMSTHNKCCHKEIRKTFIWIVLLSQHQCTSNPIKHQSNSGENPLIFTQVIVSEQKYGCVTGR